MIEEILNRHQIAYRIYGGLRFYDRSEIKDALCYMRLVINKDDNAAFDRVINQPARGIGKQTLSSIREHANSHRISLFAAAKALCQTNELTNRAQTAVTKFIDLIANINQSIATKTLGEAASVIINQSGIVDFYKKDKKEISQAKLENLDELINAAQVYNNPDDPEATPKLADFLANSIIGAEVTNEKDSGNAIDLMTLHAAKGLEYSLVFLTGLEEGLFPHKMATIEENRLEEERRLCYVGITRAKQKLCITHASTRRFHGSENVQAPSRFLHEIPPELTQEIRVKRSPVAHNSWNQTAQYRKPESPRKTNVADRGGANSNTFRLGQRVQHSKFGQGTVLNYEGDKSTGRVQIRFKQGEKWLVTSFAKLEVLN